MHKEWIWPVLAAFVVVASTCPRPDNQKSDVTRPVAVVNIGKILFETTELTAYRQNQDGEMQPALGLSGDEIDRLHTEIKDVKQVIDELRAEHGFSLVIRRDSTARDMEIPIGSPSWKPKLIDDADGHFANDSSAGVVNLTHLDPVLTDEERQIRKRNWLVTELEERIVSINRIDITELAIERLRLKKNKRR